MHQKNPESYSRTVRMFSLFLWDRPNISVREREAAWLINAEQMLWAGWWRHTVVGAAAQRLQHLLWCTSWQHVRDLSKNWTYVFPWVRFTFSLRSPQTHSYWALLRCLLGPWGTGCWSGHVSDSFRHIYFHSCIYSPNIYQAPVLCQTLCWKLGLNRNKATSLPKASQTNQSLKCCVMCHSELVQAAQRRATEPKQGQRRHPRRQAKVGWVMRAGGLPGKGAASRMAKGKQDHDPVVLILAGINYWCPDHHTGLLSQNLCR